MPMREISSKVKSFKCGVRSALILPPAVAGLLLLMTFGRRGWIGGLLSYMDIQLPFTMAAVVMAQLFVGLPIYIKTAAQGFMGVDERLELTAMTLGDSS